MPQIPEPVKVSPLIKLFRYSFLAAGIIYGASKLKTLQVLEEGKKEERERRRIEREVKLAEEKKAASERDIAAIVAIFKGTSSESEPNVADQGYTPENTAASKIQGKDLTRLVQEDKASTRDVTRVITAPSNDSGKDPKSIQDDKSLNRDDTSCSIVHLDEKTCSNTAEDSSSCTAAEVKQVVQETFGVDNSPSARTELKKPSESPSTGDGKDMFSSSLNLGKAKDTEVTGEKSVSAGLGMGNEEKRLVQDSPSVEVKHEVAMEGKKLEKVTGQIPKDKDGQDRV